MKISIVTPSYNQSDFLPICLRSVAGQSYSDIEHIIVDGGSNDGSVQILDDFKQKEDRIIYTSGPDNGQGDAVNKGFAQATGDIIAWINSDDYYFDENVFGDVVSIFKANPDIDVLYGGLVYVDSHDRMTHVRIPPKYSYSRLTRIAYIVNSNTFYRKKVIERHLIDPDYHFVIDHEYMLRITKDFKPMRTERILACFRVQPEAKTQTMTEKSKNIERSRRDGFHGISTGILYKLFQCYDRIIYRLINMYTDLKYLPLLKDNPPYKKFIRGSKRVL